MKAALGKPTASPPNEMLRTCGKQKVLRRMAGTLFGGSLDIYEMSSDNWLSRKI